MEKEELMQRVAELEFTNDQLISELKYLDGLMRTIGFTDGLATVKATAQELIHREELENDSERDAA